MILHWCYRKSRLLTYRQKLRREDLKENTPQLLERYRPLCKFGVFIISNWFVIVVIPFLCISLQISETSIPKSPVDCVFRPSKTVDGVCFIYFLTFAKLLHKAHMCPGDMDVISFDAEMQYFFAGG